LCGRKGEENVHSEGYPAGVCVQAFFGRSMLDALGADALAHVCAHCDFETTERCMRTCRALREVASDDGFFRLLANLQWGEGFWREALSRRTPKRFRGMRVEMARIDAFQRMLRSYGLDEWTASDFRSFWAYEAQVERGNLINQSTCCS
jgi:hypothetical protein